MSMIDMPTGDLGIKIQFERGSADPSRVFRSMTALIDAFENIDRALVTSIDTKIEPVLLLEDVEASSLTARLRSLLSAIEDDALKKLDWKPIVGTFAVKAKYILIDFLNRNTTISSREDLLELQAKILEEAKETNVRQLPAYEPVRTEQVASALDQITRALQPLGEHDSAIYLSEFGDVPFNLTFGVAPERLEELLIRDTRTNRAVMFLKVKKPDYLGESQWDVRHDARTIQVSIADREWLRKFQDRQVSIQPGDSIEADVEWVVNYGYDGEVVSSRYTVHEVIDVRHNTGEQGKLPLSDQ